MRLSYEAFCRQAPSSLAPLYCLMGDELLLRNELLDALRQQGRAQGVSERVSLIFDGDGQWHRLQEQLQSTSLFADKKFIEVHIPNGKVGRQGGPALLNMLTQLQQGRLHDMFIVVILPKLDKKTQESKWAKALIDNAFSIDIPAITAAQLPNWIRHRLAAQGQDIAEDALQQLIERTEGNLLATQQEIAKLALLHPPGRIDHDTIAQNVRDVARFDVFQLTEAMLAGDSARSLRIAQGLHDEGQALLMILAMIVRELRLLYRLAQEPAPQRPALMRQLRIFSNKQALYQSALQRLTLLQTMRLLQHANDIDRLSKGLPCPGRLQDPWAELRTLLWRCTHPL